MTTKHTPGPWLIRKHPEAACIDISDNPNSSVGFATVWGFGANNVNLIAAAPELLDALQGMVDRFHSHSTDHDEKPKTFGCNHMAETCPMCEGLVTGWKAVREARAAIAKATGEQA